MVASPKQIEKELIDYLIFPDRDVLSSPKKITERNAALEKVAALGNVFHQKVKIIFEDVRGPKLVETTVWGTSDNEVELKDKVKIPIKSIREIVFYQ